MINKYHQPRLHLLHTHIYTCIHILSTYSTPTQHCTTRHKHNTQTYIHHTHHTYITYATHAKHSTHIHTSTHHTPFYETWPLQIRQITRGDTVYLRPLNTLMSPPPASKLPCGGQAPWIWWPSACPHLFDCIPVPKLPGGLMRKCPACFLSSSSWFPCCCSQRPHSLLVPGADGQPLGASPTASLSFSQTC